MGLKRAWSIISISHNKTQTTGKTWPTNNQILKQKMAIIITHGHNMPIKRVELSADKANLYWPKNIIPETFFAATTTDNNTQRSIAQSSISSMHYANSEDPKIRKHLAEILAPTAFLEAGQHLLSMPTAPWGQRFWWHFAEKREFQQPRLGPTGACQLEQQRLQVRRKSKNLLAQTRSQGNGQHLLGRTQTLHEEQQQWKTYLQQKQSLSQWPLFQKPKLTTMEGNNINCARRLSLESSIPL